MHLLLAFAMSALLSLPIRAQVFQCSPGVYTDKPCEGGAKVATAKDAKWAGGKLDFQMHLKHYTVHGDSYHQVFANMLHEDGHIQHGKEFAILLKERLLGLGVVPCAELDARADQTHNTLYSNLQARDAEYDRRTSHGLRQHNQQ